MHRDRLPDDYLDQPAPDPAQFGLSNEDDGSRYDLLLTTGGPYETGNRVPLGQRVASGVSWA